MTYRVKMLATLTTIFVCFYSLISQTIPSDFFGTNYWSPLKIPITSTCTTNCYPNGEIQNSTYQTQALDAGTKWYRNKGKPMIVFNDIYGQELNKIEITEKGAGRLEVNSDNLSNGVYSYSLVIDGNVIDTKKMIKAK